MESLYTVSPRQAKGFVTQCLEAGLVPMISGSPGIGKSAIMAEIANEFNLQLNDVRLSQCDPADLSGLPNFTENGKAYFAPFNQLFPTEDMPLPEGKDGWLLFMDEFNSASKSVQAASYKLVLDRMVGAYKLHKNVAIVAAGNLASDRAIVNKLSTAMQSRLVHLQMVVSQKEWIEDVALKEKYDSRILAFLSQYPSKLMDFNPEHSNMTFSCPRTWSFVNKLIKGKEVDDTITPLLAGTITPGVAAEFVAYTKIFNDLVNIKDVIKDPLNCELPDNVSLRWAAVTHLIEKVDVENLEPILQYIERFSVDFRILFIRAMNTQKPHLSSEPCYGKAVASLAKYINY